MVVGLYEIYDSCFLLLLRGSEESVSTSTVAAMRSRAAWLTTARNGTDVNRGRAQVGLTCTCSANQTQRFSISSSIARLSLVLRCVDMVQKRGAASQLHRGQEERGEKWLICQRICVRDETALTFSRPERSLYTYTFHVQEFGIKPMHRHSRWCLYNRPGSCCSSLLPDLRVVSALDSDRDHRTLKTPRESWGGVGWQQHITTLASSDLWL